MSKLSVVLSVLNVEKEIEEVLKSVSFADEIILVDNGSSDRTLEIAKKYKTKIFERENNLMLNVNKNYGFSKATGDWILNIDGDESVSKELKEEIVKIFKEDKTEVIGYWMPRKNIIFGKWIQHSIWWPDYQLRLFKRGKGKFEEKDVHEYIKVDGRTEKLTGFLMHNNYSSVSQFIEKMDKIYTENEAEGIIKEGRNLEWLDAIRFPVDDFLKTFFAQKGYKDGLHGLVLSILQAFYAEVVFAKAWERQGFKEYNSPSFLKEVYKEFKKISKEFKYWFLTSSIQDSGNIFKKTVYKLKRRLP
jgi:glycosyltransferase involved in cell wall biosynthesis